MKVGFTIYETLRRLLLLGVAVGFIGLVLAPEEDSLEGKGVAATETDAPLATDNAVADLSPHETPELETL